MRLRSSDYRAKQQHSRKLPDRKALFFAAPLRCHSSLFAFSTVIKYFIPSFGGQSYLAFQTMSAYHTVRIAMEFRASETTGILLYNGQEGKKDFISLALVNGRVELRWDTPQIPQLLCKRC